MFNEPPYAERHVRWCEGTGNQIMITFLLYGHNFINVYKNQMDSGTKAIL